MSVSIKKETLYRLHGFCQRGEKHNNLVNRLLDICETVNQDINLSDETIDRLLRFTGCKDVDEALDMVLSKCSKILR